MTANPMEQEMLSSLISLYPDGLDGKGWHPKISSNPSLTAQVVIDNPDIEWDNLLLLGNSGLDIDFRLKTLEKMNIDDFRNIDNHTIILELPILEAIIAKLEDDGIIYLIISHGIHTIESVSWIANSDYKSSLGHIILPSREVAEWMAYNYPYYHWMVKQLISSEWMNSEWADHLLNEYNSYQNRELICYSSSPIDNFMKLFDDHEGRMGVGAILAHSRSAELTKMIITMFPDRYNIFAPQIRKAKLDDELAFELLIDPNYNKLHRSILVNENISDEARIRYLDYRLERESDQAAGIVTSLIRLYYKYEVFFTHRMSCYLYNISLEYHLNGSGCIPTRLLELMSRSEFQGCRWKRPTDYVGSIIEIDNYEALTKLITSTTCIKDITSVRYTGEITSEVIGMLFEHLNYCANWYTLTKRVDHELIISHSNIPWDSEALAERTYQLPARFAYTKRAK